MSLLFWSIAALLALLQVVYWTALFVGLRSVRATRAPQTVSPVPLSVIVAARDEEERLPALLRALSRQTHEQFEVIVVNDASEDDTAEIVRAHAAGDERVRLLEVDAPRAPRKKHALMTGIAEARYEHLAFTDADCVPPRSWLDLLGRYHAASEEELLITGYGPYRPRGGLLDRLAHWETFITGVFQAAAVGLGRPYMAVGRNMSYSRSLFRVVGGFEHQMQSLSGDDDLLVQEVVRRDLARVVHPMEPGSFVYSDAPESWSGWIRQKSRHNSAARHYPRSMQLHLTLFEGSGMLTWLAPFLALQPGLELLALHLLCVLAVCWYGSALLHERRLMRAFPFWDALYSLYNLLIAPLGFLRRPTRW